MIVHSSSRFTWDGFDLVFKEEVIASVVKDNKYPDMYRIRWMDGVLSQDFYNLSRAKDNAITYFLTELNNTTEDTIKTYARNGCGGGPDALKPLQGTHIA